MGRARSVVAIGLAAIFGGLGWYASASAPAAPVYVADPIPVVGALCGNIKRVVLSATVPSVEYCCAGGASARWATCNTAASIAANAPLSVSDASVPVVSLDKCDAGQFWRMADGSWACSALPPPQLPECEQQGQIAQYVDGGWVCAASTVAGPWLPNGEGGITYNSESVTPGSGGAVVEIEAGALAEANTTRLNYQEWSENPALNTGAHSWVGSAGGTWWDVCNLNDAGTTGPGYPDPWGTNRASRCSWPNRHENVGAAYWNMDGIVTSSAFFKNSGGGRYVQMATEDPNHPTGNCQWDLDTGERTVSGTVIGCGEIQYLDGWYRLWITWEKHIPYRMNIKVCNIPQMSACGSSIHDTVGWQVEYGALTDYCGPTPAINPDGGTGYACQTYKDYLLRASTDAGVVFSVAGSGSVTADEYCLNGGGCISSSESYATRISAQAPLSATDAAVPVISLDKCNNGEIHQVVDASWACVPQAFVVTGTPVNGATPHWNGDAGVWVAE